MVACILPFCITIPSVEYALSHMQKVRFQVGGADMHSQVQIRNQLPPQVSVSHFTLHFAFFSAARSSE